MNDVISTERGFGPFVWLAGLLSLTCGLVSFFVLSGASAVFNTTPLVAEVQVESMALPAAFELDAEEIALDLAERLQRRSTQDFALRTLLGADGQQQVADIVVPRLLNAGVIRRMIQEIPSLDTVTAVSSYQSYASLTLTNHGKEVLQDVALSVPGAVRAENSDGAELRIVTPDRNVDVLNLGPLEPGAQVQARIWFESSKDELLQQRDEFMLAARNVRNGQVNFRGTGKQWFGADLEVTPWARWLVGTIVLIAGFGGFTILLFSGKAALDARRRAGTRSGVSRA